MSCIQITVSEYFSRQQMLPVAKAITETNAYKSMHFSSVTQIDLGGSRLSFFLVFPLFSCSPLFTKCCTNIPYLSWPNACVSKTRTGNKDITFGSGSDSLMRQLAAAVEMQ